MGETKNRYPGQKMANDGGRRLAAAQTLSDHEMLAVACFHAQQAAEKSIMAIWHFEDEDPWGHSVKKLIDDFPRKDELPDLSELNDSAALLDKYYIPTRYPNGLPDLTPGQVYTKRDAAAGLDAAYRFIVVCKRWMETM